MTFSSWFAFLVVSILAAFSPGPGVLLAISTALSSGPKRVFFSTAGTVLGVCLVASLAITSVGIILRTSLIAFTVLKVAGGGYLIYLGTRQIFSQNSPLLANDSTIVLEATRVQLFRKGLLVSLTNPKGILFFTAIFPQFIDTTNPTMNSFALLVLSFSVCVMASHAFYAMSAVFMGNRFKKFATSNIANRVLGCLFILLGFGLLSLSTASTKI
jgi:homoserine/homoserine lactone efflux protein